MQFDPNNIVVQLCALGMEMEGKSDPAKAQALFLEAWEKASNDFEKFTAAHYVARHQQTIEDKLTWDRAALAFALKINDSSMQAHYPSLYLNIAKCYEDLNDLKNAQVNYKKALHYSNSLPDDGYGKMIRSGIQNAMNRLG